MSFSSDWPSQKWSNRGSHSVSVKKSSSRAWAKMLHERVLAGALQFDVGRLVLQLVPLLLEVLLQEVAVADLADFGGELVAVGELLPVLPEEAVAVVGLRARGAGGRCPGCRNRCRRCPSNRPAGRPGRECRSSSVAVVEEGRAVAEAALAQVVEAQVPVGALRRLADAQQLVHVPVGQNLRAEDVSCWKRIAAEIERGLLRSVAIIGQ